jgi:cell division protein FtsW (lipid II flippase)
VTNGVILILWEANDSIRWIVNPGLHPNELQYLVSCIAFFLVASVNLLTAFALRDAWPWRLVFVGYSVCSMVLAVILSQTLGASRNEAEDWLHIGLALYRPAQWLLLAVIVFLSAVDIVRRTPRDWLHWTGIGYVTAWVSSQSLLEFMHRFVAR